MTEFKQYGKLFSNRASKNFKEELEKFKEGIDKIGKRENLSQMSTDFTSVQINGLLWELF